MTGDPPQDGPFDRLFGNSARLVGIASLLGFAVLICGFVLLATDLRSTGRRDAARELEATAHLLADHAGRLFEVAGVALRAAEKSTEGLDWDAISASARLFDDLRTVSESLPYIESVWLNDESGLLRLTSFAFPTPFSNASDRETFRRVAAGSEELQIGERIVGRVTGRPTFLLARRLSNPDGAFRGMVSVTAELGYFADYWTRTRLPFDARVSLVRGGHLDVLAQHPAPAEGGFVPAPPGLPDTATTAEATGSLAIERPDGERTVAYQRVGQLPLYILVSVSNRAIAAEWRARLVPYAPPMIIALLALALLAAVALRQARRDRHAAADLLRFGKALERANDDLEETVAARTAALQASEAALRRLNEGLEARVQEEIRAREDAQRRLAHAQRMEALGQLAGGVAHDINNVLQIILGTAEMIEEGTTDQPTIEMARRMAEAAERGSGITQRLLAFARKSELRAQAVDPGALLVGMRDLLGHTLGDAIRVEVHLNPPLPILLADEGQLETALLNLVTNARDAMPTGGKLVLSAGCVEVGIEPTPRRDGPPLLRPGTYVRLTVSDTGGGMPPEVLARATEPFFTTKELGKGTGLGLATAHGFAEQSGGTLTIESEVGRGTQVHLWLPAPCGLRSPEGEGNPASKRRSEARLLLVDDAADVLEITMMQLESCGFRVITADSGAAALAVLTTGEPVDLLVTDLSMPGMDGLALIREARRLREGLPAILLTGFVTNAAELAVGGAITGAFSLIRKPATGEQLAERIEALLHGTTDASVTRD